MMKAEFEKKLGRGVSGREYQIIEQVYNFHPLITNQNGKAEIVALYKMGGIGLMEDMFPTANQMQELEVKSWVLQAQINDLKREKEEIRSRFR
jgi:hypothetical protein